MRTQQIAPADRVLSSAREVGTASNGEARIGESGTRVSMKTRGLWAALASVARRSRDTPYYGRQCQGGEGRSGRNGNNHLAANPSGWTPCAVSSQGRSREVAVIDCDVPFVTSPLNIDCILNFFKTTLIVLGPGLCALEFVQSTINTRFNQKGTSDSCQRSESRTTPTSGHTISRWGESGETYLTTT